MHLSFCYVLWFGCFLLLGLSTHDGYGEGLRLLRGAAPRKGFCLATLLLGSGGGRQRLWVQLLFVTVMQGNNVVMRQQGVQMHIRAHSICSLLRRLRRLALRIGRDACAGRCPSRSLP